jgi:hypothetical protein
VCRAARAHATAHTRVHPLALALLLLLPLIAARHAGLRLLHELWPGLWRPPTPSTSRWRCAL